MNANPLPLEAFSAFGIELEYMIVDRDSLAVRPIADELIRKALGSYATNVPRGRYAWSNELALHVIEVRNAAPEARLNGLAEGFQNEIQAVDALLAQFNARLMPSAMHPWMNPARETRLWPHQDAAIYRRYDRIFNCRAHGWANLQSMHLNLPFAGDAEFARLHAAIRLVLPILPALAASSPVADGITQPALDHRMACYRVHPLRVPSMIGQLIPDNTSSRADYEATVLQTMYRDIAPHDPSGLMQHEWLNTRAAIPRFDRNAIEIRVLDTQECPQADLAIAALTSALIRTIYAGQWSALAAQQTMATAALRDILFACIRDADRTLIDDPDYLDLLGYPERRCEAGELWQHLRAACSADPLLAQANPLPLDLILSRGPLARRIIAALGDDFDQSRLQAVYRELCECLAAGRLFDVTEL